MWLLGKLAPDFKTIADFRKDNGLEIKNVCKTFLEVCRKLNMFEGTAIAIDGSKFKASNNKSNNYTPSKVKFYFERVEKHIARYLELLNATFYVIKTKCYLYLSGSLTIAIIGS